ncbi:MAG: MASE1 domain-containing protein [Nakamurella sp.]
MQLAHPVLRSGFVPAASAVALLTGVTYVVVWFSLWFLRDGQGSSPWWWPATGVALAVLLHAPRRWWFPMIIGYGVANGLASRGADDVATTLVYLFVNVIELSVAAAVLGGNELRHSARGVTGRPVRRADNVAGGGLTSEGRSSTPRRATRFAVATVLAIGLGAATIAVTGLMGIGHAASYGIVDGYVVTHALGMVTLGPLMMPTARVGRTTAAHRAETAAVIAAAIGIGLWAFFDSNAVGRAFLTLLPVIWAAIRLDAAWTSLISLGTCLFAVYSATRNLGTFAEIAGRGVQHGNVQLFVLTVGTVALALVLITRHRAQLAELVRDSENTLRIAVQDALVGMYSIRFDPGYIGEIRDANTAFSVMLGYRPAELNGVSSRLIGLGPGYRERLPPVEIAAFDTWMESFARGEPESFRRETQFYAKDGVRLWAEVSATRVTPVGQPPFALVHVHDLTSRFEHQTRLERMALHDALTGLANRVLLFRRITTALDTARGQDGNRSVGLL